MKTLNEFLEESLLTEILDNPYPYREVSSITSRKFKFETEDGREFEVEFGTTIDIQKIISYANNFMKQFSKFDDAWDLIDYHIENDLRHLQKMKIWHLSFSDEKGRMDVTGKGDAFRILATVGNITNEFVRKEIAKTEGGLIFLSDKDERSRVRLYSTFTKRIEKELPLKKISKDQLKEFDVLSKNTLEEKILQDVLAEGLYSYLERYASYEEVFILLTPGVFNFFRQETELNQDMIRRQ